MRHNGNSQTLTVELIYMKLSQTLWVLQFPRISQLPSMVGANLNSKTKIRMAKLQGSRSCIPMVLVPVREKGHFQDPPEISNILRLANVPLHCQNNRIPPWFTETKRSTTTMAKKNLITLISHQRPGICFQPIQLTAHSNVYSSRSIFHLVIWTHKCHNKLQSWTLPTTNWLLTQLDFTMAKTQKTD